MTAKKSLENRIRGWFPQEPTMFGTRLKADYENTRYPPTIPSGYNVSATKTAGIFAIFWILLYMFQSFTFLNLERIPISTLQVAAWIIAGLAVGTISSIMLTKNQLGRILKDYQFSTNGKDIVLLVVPAVLFFIFGFFVSLSIYGIMYSPSLEGWLISIFAWGGSMFVTRYFLFFTFERKENMRLMRSWWGMEIFLIPRAPDSTVNGTKINTKNIW
jgi:hypothetical protein